MRKSSQKGSVPWHGMGTIFDNNRQKIIPKIIRINCGKTLNVIPKGCQNGCKLDAKSHQQLMPKQVAKQIMEIIKNNVFLMCKNIQIHCSFVGCVHKPKRYQQIIENKPTYSSKFKINATPILGKVVPKGNPKTIQTASKLPMWEIFRFVHANSHGVIQ